MPVSESFLEGYTSDLDRYAMSIVARGIVENEADNPGLYEKVILMANKGLRSGQKLLGQIARTEVEDYLASEADQYDDVESMEIFWEGIDNEVAKHCRQIGNYIAEDLLTVSCV